MNHGVLAVALARRLPFYYGWIILGCVCCVAVARTGPAVATLSLFVGPMTAEFGWSRSAFSGAVSLGGVLAALSSPMIGSFLDRAGPRFILMVAVLTTGATILLLSGVQTLLGFYCLFCIARMNFAGPFDLGIYGAVANWFVARRPFVTSLATLVQMAGLTLMPLVAFWAMSHGGAGSGGDSGPGDWRAGWLAVGVTVLVMGFLPTWALMVRRPEDLGLEVDGAGRHAVAATGPGAGVETRPPEPTFSRAEALRTRAFWMLSLYTLLIYPVQAGMSLHQAAHLTEIGLGRAVAVSSVAAFSAASGVSGLLFGMALRRIGVCAGLVISAVLVVGGALLMRQVANAHEALAAAILFGVGMGGIHIGLPVAWADYFGRRSYGAIRGVALAIQVAAQAVGPLLSGVLRDLTGNYGAALAVFAALSAMAALAALLVRAPLEPDRPAP